MWLAGRRKKNIKGFSYKNFLVSNTFFQKDHTRKIIQFSEDEIANFDVNPTSIHVQRFTGHVSDRSILNDWSVQKTDLLTPKLDSLCNIAKYLAHAVPTCKRVKLMVKVWFSVLVYRAFRAFVEAMKYTLFEVTITRLKFYQGLSKSGKKPKNQLHLVIIFQEFQKWWLMKLDYIFLSFVLFLWGRVKNFISCIIRHM